MILALQVALAVAYALLAHAASVGSARAALAALLVVPVAFVWLVAWVFARSLRAGRVPLINRIVSGLDRVPPERLEPEVAAYARRLTGAWAAVLFGLGVANLVLALLATPGGLLDQVGLASPWPITRTQWSWFANLLNYGVVGGFFLLEFQWRQRRFPGRYQGFLDFLRRMGGLGQAFWRDLLR